ncbi:hypothetical protein L1887_16681 [Cichorium endivia]|nr:hypothetical protein L1887_16681 [Cichorium endivia]
MKLDGITLSSSSLNNGATYATYSTLEQVGGWCEKVIALEYVGLSPKGSQIQSFLEKAAEGIVAGGK